jgi:hypothetical protein
VVLVLVVVGLASLVESLFGSKADAKVAGLFQGESPDRAELARARAGLDSLAKASGVDVEEAADTVVQAAAPHQDVLRQTWEDSGAYLAGVSELTEAKKPLAEAAALLAAEGSSGKLARHHHGGAPPYPTKEKFTKLLSELRPSYRMSERELADGILKTWKTFKLAGGKLDLLTFTRQLVRDRDPALPPMAEPQHGRFTRHLTASSQKYIKASP